MFYMTTGKYCEQLSQTANRITVLIINSPWSMYATCCKIILEVAIGITVFPKAGGTKLHICVRIFIYYMQFSLRYFFIFAVDEYGVLVEC